MGSQLPSSSLCESVIDKHHEPAAALPVPVCSTRPQHNGGSFRLSTVPVEPSASRRRQYLPRCLTCASFLGWQGTVGEEPVSMRYDPAAVELKALFARPTVLALPSLPTRLSAEFLLPLPLPVLTAPLSTLSNPCMPIARASSWVFSRAVGAAASMFISDIKLSWCDRTWPARRACRALFMPM